MSLKKRSDDTISATKSLLVDMWIKSANVSANINWEGMCAYNSTRTNRLHWKTGWNIRTTIFKSLKAWRRSATIGRKSWMTLGKKLRIRMLPDLREQQETQKAISKTWNILNCG